MFNDCFGRHRKLFVDSVLLKRGESINRFARLPVFAIEAASWESCEGLTCEQPSLDCYWCLERAPSVQLIFFDTQRPNFYYCPRALSLARHSYI